VSAPAGSRARTAQAGRTDRPCDPARGDRHVPQLHAIAADEVLDRRGFVDDARALLDWGGPEVALHLRAHGRPGGALFALARRLAPVAQASGALLVVNDRVDVALAAAIESVQLGVGYLPHPSPPAIVATGKQMGD